mmetsp:Transcript_67748/g.218904  ORF Transcript_67748/g.218904 Transcript_67748/m.218904 type:complete len:266 (-) Transcript_67748:177-974(-)
MVSRYWMHLSVIATWKSAAMGQDAKEVKVPSCEGRRWRSLASFKGVGQSVVAAAGQCASSRALGRGCGTGAAQSAAACLGPQEAVCWAGGAEERLLAGAWSGLRLLRGGHARAGRGSSGWRASSGAALRAGRGAPAPRPARGCGRGPAMAPPRPGAPAGRGAGEVARPGGRCAEPQPPGARPAPVAQCSAVTEPPGSSCGPATLLPVRSEGAMAWSGRRADRPLLGPGAPASAASPAALVLHKAPWARCSRSRIVPRPRRRRPSQ